MARSTRPLVALASAAVAAGTLATLAVPAQAQDYRYGSPYGYDRGSAAYCDHDRGQRQAAGATFGAAIGAVAGSQIAARGRRTEGSVLGGVVGAMIGAGVGSGSSSSECRGYDDRYGYDRSYDDRRYGYQQSYGYQQPYDRRYDDRRHDDRRYGYDAYGRDGYGCRTVQYRERDRWGREVITSREVCDGYGY
ncbi:MAG TPA: hypothetical protein VGR32_09760 [Brevundimonas sp.]|uniref:hypothetical protein n=1 Tax=Brevundimonas sp. TaxID=1871086 RepID=UPI002DE3675A|nr:hypothetical protein [Brevundimonas sp.]